MERSDRAAFAAAFAAICPMLSGIAYAAPVSFASTGTTPLRVSVTARATTRETALAAYKIVNLSTLLGGAPIDFIPTALNDAGAIVGYDNEMNRTHGNFGASYLILPNGTYGALDNTGNKPAYFIPNAISNTGQSISGNYLQFDLRHQTEFTGPVTWSYSSTKSHQFYRQLKAPPIVALASGNVPVGGAYYFGFTTFSATPFKTTGCAIDDFSATAINDSGEIVGVGGGHAVTDTLTGCPAPIVGLPVIAHTATSPDAINSHGDLLISLTGSAVSAFGRRYIDVKGKLTQITLPAAYSASAFYIDALALSGADAVVGNIMQQAPPFGIVAPFLFHNGSSIDLNSLLPAKSGWRLLTAVSVNASGEIIGTGYYNGVLQGYALKP